MLVLIALFGLLAVVAASGAWDTATVTITSTITTTQTATRTVSASYCPTSTAPPSCTTSITLNFDDINCSGICPFPLNYRSFFFNGASGWQLVNKAALPVARNEYLAVSSQPNALLTQSSGPVDFGSVGQGFTFDVIRFRFSTFTIDNTTNVVFIMNGTTASGELRTYSTTMTSGIYISPDMIDLTTPPGQALQFTNLVDLSVAAYSQYDPATKTGVPSVLIFDDVELVKHVGGQF